MKQKLKIIYTMCVMCIMCMSIEVSANEEDYSQPPEIISSSTIVVNSTIYW